jgi:carbohydrate kinase (thermoresistant glucokinase family)|tara:strand:- start:95 stop:592 length:498 start_codon:yes stop_codon:yes gene_type:complete
MKNKFITILLMGVAGAGKTTVGKVLTDKINGYFIEADDFHGKNNIKKMSAGIPLNDNDRYDWLIKIKNEILKRKAKQNLIIACSSLKEKYRELLGTGNYKLVFLKVDKLTAKNRINSRDDHFMPETLVDSQFSILEEPENALVFEQSLNQDQIVNEIIKQLKIVI